MTDQRNPHPHPHPHPHPRPHPLRYNYEHALWIGEKAPDANAAPSGLKWVPLSAEVQLEGTEIVHEALAKTLVEKTELTPSEWAAFGIQGLRFDHYVRSKHHERLTQQCMCIVICACTPCTNGSTGALYVHALSARAHQSFLWRCICLVAQVGTARTSRASLCQLFARASRAPGCVRTRRMRPRRGWTCSTCRVVVGSLHCYSLTCLLTSASIEASEAVAIAPGVHRGGHSLT